jgi:hypothetical protein
MTGLSRLVEEHYGAVEADWRRYYGRSLKSDLWGTTHLGAREVIQMMRWLPPEAALWRSAGTSWSTENELQAITVEHLDALLRTYIQAHSKPNSQKQKPLHIPRPWDKAVNETKRRTTLGEMLGNGLTVRKAPKSIKGGE